MSDTYTTMEDAITEHIKSGGDDGVMVTGWILVASISSLDHDSSNIDGYVTFTSQGLPHHTQIGLLNVSLDDRKASAMFASMNSMIMMIDDGDDEDGDDE